jgi:diguanylate cyclase (GGDEF)-like protein
MADRAMPSPRPRRDAAVTIAVACMAAARACAVHPASGLASRYLMAVVLACVLLTGLRPGRRRDYPAGICGMWELTAVALAPPVFAFIVPPAAAAAGCWRDRGLARGLDAVAAGLADGVVSVAFHAVASPQPPPGTAGPEWLGAVAAAGILRQVLTCAVFRLVRRGKRLPCPPGGRERLRAGLAELGAGILVTCSAVVSPLCVLLAVPLATPLQRSLQHARLARHARTDLKTGLLNAAAWQQDAAAEITRAAHARLPLAMAMVDIDHFKAVNDTHGHLAGDQVLHAVAGIIRSQLRDYDIAGRFGGEEFAVLLPHTQPGQARRVAERLRLAVAAARLAVGAGNGPPARVRVTVSAGVTSLAECGPGLHALIAAADAALYDAKAAGRNRVRFWRGQLPDAAAPAGHGACGGCATPLASSSHDLRRAAARLMRPGSGRPRSAPGAAPASRGQERAGQDDGSRRARRERAQGDAARPGWQRRPRS